MILFGELNIMQNYTLSSSKLRKKESSKRIQQSLDRAEEEDKVVLFQQNKNSLVIWQHSSNIDVHLNFFC